VQWIHGQGLETCGEVAFDQSFCFIQSEYAGRVISTKRKSYRLDTCPILYIFEPKDVLLKQISVLGDQRWKSW
jgi:hypothetical protein